MGICWLRLSASASHIVLIIRRPCASLTIYSKAWLVKRFAVASTIQNTIHVRQLRKDILTQRLLRLASGISLDGSRSRGPFTSPFGGTFVFAVDSALVLPSPILRSGSFLASKRVVMVSVRAVV